MRTLPLALLLTISCGGNAAPADVATTDSAVDTSAEQDVASAEDSGSSDLDASPSSDASLDARVLDARVLDARVLDARVLDARVLDARVLDARVLDARVDARSDAPADVRRDSGPPPICTMYCDCMQTHCAGRFASRTACLSSCTTLRSRDPEALDCRLSYCMQATRPASTQCTNAFGGGTVCQPF